MAGFAPSPSAAKLADPATLLALKKRDREVRQHEQAHMAAGGQLILGGATYRYQQGPDGQRYAVGGEVSIDTSPGRTPQETLAKAQTIRAAALAPMNPSGADRAAAAKASAMEAQARQDLSQQVRDEAKISSEQKSGAAFSISQSLAAYQQGQQLTERTSSTFERSA